MPYYSIEAVDREGNVIKKVIEVESEIDIKDLLQRDWLFLVDYKPASDFIVKLKKLNPFKRKKIKAVEIVELFENLHLMIKAGVPVSVAINDLSKEMQNKHLKFILEDIYKIITSGGSLYEGFSKYKNVFGDVILTLVKVGEETGGLEKVLKDAAVYLKRIEDIKAKTKQALIYPSFTTTSFSNCTNPFQYSFPYSITGKGLSFFVCIKVNVSVNSSRVPNPPGNRTNAVAYFTNITFLEKK